MNYFHRRIDLVNNRITSIGITLRTFCFPEPIVFIIEKKKKKNQTIVCFLIACNLQSLTFVSPFVFSSSFFFSVK